MVVKYPMATYRRPTQYESWHPSRSHREQIAQGTLSANATKNMNTPSHAKLAVRSSVIFALVLAVWSPIPMQSAEPPAGKAMTEGKMMERCQAMKEQREKMMAETKAQDAELAAQVVAMNSAPENRKVVLLAAIVTRMVENTTASHARMSAMQAEMMPHMMEHMSPGAESMAACPMMKGMGDIPAEDRKAHHPTQK